MKNKSAVLAIAGAMLATASAFADFNEGFNTGLPTASSNQTGAGIPIVLGSGTWHALNVSAPASTVTGVFQGNTGVFTAQSGAGYAGMNYQCGTGTSNLNLFLMTPVLTLTNGDTLSFWTRTVTSVSFPDRLQIRMSTNGASTAAADFSTILLQVNPTLTLVGFPSVWTQYTATVSGLGGPTSGRLAFNYNVPNGGPSGANSDYIGIDNAVYTQFVPPALTLSAAGTCYHVNDIITVNVNVTNLPVAAAGGQFFLNFDPTKLQFLSAVPGDPGLPGSGLNGDFPPFPPPTNPANPFEVEVYQCTGETILGFCTPLPGRLDYAVGTPGGGVGSGSIANNTMAVLRFKAIAEACNTSGLVRFRDNVSGPLLPPTRLTDEFGVAINPALVDLGAITIDSTAPVITCPPLAKVECPTPPTPANTGAATAVDACDSTPTIAYTDFTVDLFGSPSGWASRNENTASGATVVGPPVPPAGVGSFKVQTGAGNGPGQGGKNYLFTGLFDNFPLLLISELKYWTYVATAANPNLAPSLNLYVDWDNNGTRDTTLVFEPTYVTGGAIPAGWQQWNALGSANAWWYNTSFGLLTNPAGEYHPLSYYLAIYPNAKIVNWAGAPGFNIVTGQASGGSWANFVGNIDMVEINGFNFDFEPGPFCAHTIFRTWTATDDCNNLAYCTQQIFVIDTLPPVFNNACPLPTINVNCDAGTCLASSATVNPTIPTVTEACSSASLSFSRSDGKLYLSDSYSPADSPIVITWTATDSCGNVSTCTQTVIVSAYNELLLTVQLQPNIAPPGNLTRCIRLELWNCPGGPTIVDAPITFTVTAGGPNVALASSAQVLVPCGVYNCITARDRLHTLRRTDEGFGIVGTKYVADFTGDPSSGGDWLIGGNLNDDPYIDILDFGTFISQYNTLIFGGNGNTTCSTPYPHADISGDGFVNSADFTFIQINFLKFNEANCCGAPLRLAAGDGGEQPITRISVKDLIRRGMKDLTIADLNNDGWLDTADVQQFMNGGGPANPNGHR